VLAALCVVNFRPDYPFRRFVTSDSASGSIVRRLLPSAVGFTFVTGWLILKAYKAGYFSEAIGLALFSTASIGGLSALILWNAGLLYEADAQRREAERKLSDYSLNLEQMVRERTQEAESAKLLALSCSRAKSDFLANMSHELRTPLNSIIGFSEVLLDELYGKLNEKQKVYVNYVHVSGRHLLSLINEILDLSKVESGKMELEPGEFFLKDTLTASLALFREKATKHNINMSLHIAPDADRLIWADERKIKQVIFNLLSNALKFTPDNEAVCLQARYFPDRDWIEIAVSDTGLGIKAEDLPLLFRPFTQLETGLAKEYEGTGLGLALSKSLVELHGGEIRVQSEHGKGSSFIFTIPAGGGHGKEDTHS
jgi:signal transduction histidine kinase